MSTIIFTSGYTHMVLTGRIEIVINPYDPSLMNIYHGSGWGYISLQNAGTLRVSTL